MFNITSYLVTVTGCVIHEMCLACCSIRDSLLNVMIRESE